MRAHPLLAIAAGVGLGAEAASANDSTAELTPGGFCEEGVKKTGPTTFEVRHANFTATRDHDILILYRPKL